MSSTIVQNVRTPTQLKEVFPLSDEQQKSVLKHRDEIKQILKGNDKRKLLIVGPCSAWPCDAVIEYAQKLKELESEVNNIKIVLRVYTQKPRTTIGWSGLAKQPDPFKPINIDKGLEEVRKLMIQIIDLGLPIADEIVAPQKFEYVDDMLSWFAIGARTTESQPHRLLASGADMPVGFKNSTQGNIDVAVNGIISAQHSHEYLHAFQQIKTSGNPYAHLILRGGNNTPNYDRESLQLAILKLASVKTQAIIVDASHDNAIDFVSKKKDASRQPIIIEEVCSYFSDGPINNIIKGFMVESFLQLGNQKISSQETCDGNGLSITDPCLGWGETKNLIIDLDSSLEEYK